MVLLPTVASYPVSTASFFSLMPRPPSEGASNVHLGKLALETGYEANPLRSVGYKMGVIGLPHTDH